MQPETTDQPAAEPQSIIPAQEAPSTPQIISPQVSPQPQEYNPVPQQEPLVTQVPQTPAYVGNSNVTDRSGQNNIYPTLNQEVPRQNPPTFNDNREEAYKNANSALYEIIALVLGFFSSASMVVTAYISHSLLISMFVPLIFAAGAVFATIKDYKQSQKLSPWSIIGLCGATLTLVLITDYWVVRLIVKAAINSISNGY